MIYNESTDVKVLVYPSGSLPTPSGHRFALYEQISGLLKRSEGDSVEAPVASDVPDTWSGQEGFAQIDSTLDVVRFNEDGTAAFGTANLTGKESLVGFILKRSHIPFNCRLVNSLPGDPDSNKAFPDLLFRQTKPRVTDAAPSRFRVKLPSRAPFRTCLQYHDVSRTTTVSIESLEKITANSMLRFEIGWLQSVPGETKANARFIWGDKWSIARRQGQAPTLDLMVNGKWEIQSRLGKWKDYSTDETWHIERLFGRIVLTCIRPDATESFWVSEKHGNEAITATWPAAPIRINLYGVAATVGVGVLRCIAVSKVKKHGETVTKFKPATGQFKRRRTQALNYQGPNHFKGDTKGWKTRSATAEVELDVNNRYTDYTVTLTASKNFVDTPGVCAVLAQAPRNWQQNDETPLDIRPACFKLTGKSADPAMAGTSSTEWTVEVDRHILANIVAADWPDQVKKYAPLKIMIRRRLSDGTFTEWDGLFSGYIRSIEKANPAFNDWKMTLHCLDDTIRLSAPAAVLKPQHHLPLDHLAERGQPIYSGDCIQEIVRIELGDDWADTINGNGDTRAFTPSEAPILDMLAMEGLTEESSQKAQAIYLPVPYYQDALSWMKQIAEKVCCVLFFGKVPEYPTMWPVLIYGRYGNIVAGRVPKTFYDARYLGGDLNRLLLDVKTEDIPTKDFNQVIVIGTDEISQGTTTQFLSGEAHLGAGHPDNAINSWPRTQVVKDKYSKFLGAEGLQYTATLMLAGIACFTHDAPSFTGRGDETLQWGDLVTLCMNSPDSDATLGLNNRTFRVLTWQHDISLLRDRVDDFTTAVTLAEA